MAVKKMEKMTDHRNGGGRRPDKVEMNNANESLMSDSEIKGALSGLSEQNQAKLRKNVVKNEKIDHGMCRVCSIF